MSLASLLLIGAGAGALAAVVLSRYLRGRFARAVPAFELALAGMGLILVGGSLVAGRVWLDTEPPPPQAFEGAGIGVVAPDAVPSEPERGFVTSLGAEFEECDEPVAVTLIVGGTAEYFKDRLRDPRAVTRLVIGVPSQAISNLRVGYTQLAGDLASPFGSEQHGVGNAEPDVVKLEGVGEHEFGTSVSVTLRNWADTVASVVLRFDAEWLVDRGLGTCYLALPPLVGGATIFGGAIALGDLDSGSTGGPLLNPSGEYSAPYDHKRQVTQGISKIRTGRSELLDFRPQENLGATDHGLSCSGAEPSIGDLGSGRDGEVVMGLGGIGNVASASFFREGARSNCSVVATLAEESASSTRDFRLLILGALFSLGAAMVLEAGLDLRRRGATSRSR